MSIFHIYMYNMEHVFFASYHPAPLQKKLTVFIGSEDLLANEVQLLFHPGKTRHLPTQTPNAPTTKKMVAAKLICASKILSVINQPQTTSGKNDDRCVGTRAFVSSSPRRRIAPSCPPSNDGSSNNPPANHFFKRKSSMEG